MFISCVHFYDQEQYLLVKVQCQSFAGMITQDSEKSFFVDKKKNNQCKIYYTGFYKPIYNKRHLS